MPYKEAADKAEQERIETEIAEHKETLKNHMRKNNLFCTQLLGPILPLNPLFCEYLLRLCGSDATAAYRKEAMAAYEQRLEEFRAPKKSSHH